PARQYGVASTGLADGHVADLRCAAARRAHATGRKQDAGRSAIETVSAMCARVPAPPARQTVRAVTVSPRRLRFRGAGCYTSNRLPRPWQTYDASPRTPTPPRVAWGGIDLSRYVDAIANAVFMTVP